MKTQPLSLYQFWLLSLVALATSSCAVSPTSPKPTNFGSAWQTVDCKTFDVPESIAAISDCGYVTTPEEHALGQSRTIQLAVVRTRSTGKKPATDPIFVEQGGPGDSTIGVFVNMALPGKSPGLIALLENRDLVFVEERGTRYSKPFLSCPEINAHNIAVAKGEIDYTDAGWIQSCNARFISEDVNPNAFNTRENAADIYFVAETLGYPQFNFYGGSYGTLLGQYVIAQADKHKAKLRSAILDGVVRPDIDFNLAFSHTMSHALRNLFHDCEQDRQCGATYPNLEQKFLTTLNQLNQKPIPITLKVPSTNLKIVSKLDGNAFVDAILGSLYRTDEVRNLPKQMDIASQGNFEWIIEQLSGGLESSNAKEMYNTVLCARTKSIIVLPSEALPAPYPELLPAGQRESETVRNACKAMNVAQKPPFIYENTEIPTLIFNGEFDPATPQPYGETVAKHFKTAYVYTFPSVGHIALILRPSQAAATCSGQIATDFMNNPNQAPNSSCITQIKPSFATQ